MNKINPSDGKRASYEIFILLLTLLSLFNLLIIIFVSGDDIRRVAFMVNILISIIFLFDFFLRLNIADVKKYYFFRRYGWLDLIGSIPIPGFNLARIWRVFRAIRLLRREGSREVLRQVAQSRANTALLSIGLAVIYLLEFGSMLILRAESDAPLANINTADDALWWVFVTISTVGYGDKYPVTDAGRFVAIFVIFAGVGVFGTLSGYLANAFLGQRRRETETKTDSAADPVLVELKALHEAQAEAQAKQEEANESLQARLVKLEKLLQKSR